MLAGIVLLITLLMYFPALRNDFVVESDDLPYIIENSSIRSLNGAFFKWAFFDFYRSNWHPLTWMSHAIDYAVWGLNPIGHHLTNIVIHAINSFLVVLLITRLLQAGRKLTADKVLPAPSSVKKGTSPSSPLKKGGAGTADTGVLIAAATTGLLFGLHPLHVESVAWVSERKDLLCALFFLLSVMSYMTYATCGTKKNYILSLIFFVLALMSKPMAVSLPAVLLILDWYPLERIGSIKTARSAVVEKLPFIALSFASSVVTVLAQKSGGALVPLEAVPLSVRAAVVLKSPIAYIGKMILPLNLLPFYPYPNSKDVSFLSMEYFSAAVLMGGITIACIATAKRHRVWLSAWCYYLITLIPVLGIFQVGSQSMADRYTYLPSLGPFLIAGLAAAWGYTSVNSLIKKRLIIGLFSATLSILLFSSLTYLTLKQIGIWKNSIDLWSSIIEKGSEKAMAYNNRGEAFERMGRMDEAVEDYRKAVAIAPNATVSYYHLGEAFMRKGQYDEAIKEYKRVVSLDPNFTAAYFNLGVAYASKGLRDEAIMYYKAALKLKPDYTEAHFNLGVIYLGLGLAKEAKNEFEGALRTDPSLAEARLFLEYAGKMKQ